jgi:polyisoprenoid-binding protein YceI
VDPVHSSTVFRIKHLNTAPFYGTFNELTGSITFDPAKPEAASMDLTVKIDSVETHNPRRNSDVKGASFFNAAEFPTATFKSTSWKKASENAFDVAGDLTIRGVTKPVTVKFEKTGEAEKGPMGAPVIGFAADFSIKRSDYGMTYMPDGLSDEVKLMVGIEAKAGGKGG